MEAVCLSETSVDFKHTADNNHGCENLRSLSGLHSFTDFPIVNKIN
jgi:hypothetical protein